MTLIRPTFRVPAYALTVVVALAGALVTGRPEPAVLATPFAVALVVLLTSTAPDPAAVTVWIDGDRLAEGDIATVDLAVRPGDTELLPELPDGVELEETTTTDTGVRLTLRFERWGVYDVGHVVARVFDPWRAWTATSRLHAPLKVRVHPAPARLEDSPVAAMELQPFVGHHRSRLRGDGFEFADLRPYRPGDRPRSINWRATSRRGELWVNERHPDRASEIVILLDTFGSGHRARERSLDVAVRAVAAVADSYARTHDRVGLLTFGGHLRWLAPSSGRRHVARIADALLDTESLLTDAWAGVDRVPVGAIPPRSLLLAVTPLDSDTAATTLLDLRARGFDVAAIIVPTMPPRLERAEPALVHGTRLDGLLRDARRLQLERLGIAVAVATDSLPAALREVDECRRRMPRVRA